MRAVLCRDYGGPERLSVEEVPVPQPGPGEIRVSIKAAGVNFPDVLMIQNKHQFRPPLPFAPGYEIAGVVSALGPGVAGIAPGDAGVAMLRYGGFAEEAIVPAERFWRIPAGLDFVTAAAFPLAYGTSYYALAERGRLQAAETLLVLGAAGGVGLAAVQLGKLMGATVIACASSAEKLATCRAHGADHLVDYRRRNLRDALKELTGERGVDVVLDPVGGDYAEPAVRSMAWLGRYLIVGFTGGSIPRIPANLALLKGCSLIGVLWDTYTRRNPAGGRKYIAQMVDWILQGRLRPVVTRCYPLADAARALEDVIERRVQGKMVIVP